MTTPVTLNLFNSSRPITPPKTATANDIEKFTGRPPEVEETLAKVRNIS